MSDQGAAHAHLRAKWQEWTLALDIGEASIGWAVGIVDGSGGVHDILNTGVRLFTGAWFNDTGTFKAYGAEDRIARGQQRRFEGKQRRLATLTRLFATAAGISPQEMKARVVFSKGQAHRDPAEVFGKRARAAREPLALDDLYQVLHHMAAHRGIRLAAPEGAPLASRDKKGKERRKAQDDDGDEATAASARESEHWFRGQMAAAKDADGSGPTCGEILHTKIQADRGAHGRRSQPLIRARHGVDDQTGVMVPTRALIAEEFDRIRSIQESHHAALDWNGLRTLVLDQQPIALPPAARCLFLGELLRRNEPFDGRPIDPESIARGLVNDPLMQALRIREAVGNLRLGTEQDGSFGKIWVPRVLDDQELKHGELTAAERDVLVDALMRLPEGIRTDSGGYVTYAALRGALGLRGKERFGIERDDRGGGIKPNPTDPVLSRWIPGWFDQPIEARSLYYRELAERRADSRRLRAFLGAGGHGVGPVPADLLDAATATLLESDLFSSPLYSVCHAAAQAILKAWTERPTVGFYDLTRDLFRFAPNEVVLEDLREARAHLHENLPYLAPRTPGTFRAQPLKDYTEVIPSQLVTTLRRGHKGRGDKDPDTWKRRWTGNAATHRILSEVRKVANTLVNRYGGRQVAGCPLAPLPSTITVELAREAKHGVMRRQEIEDQNREHRVLAERSQRHLDEFCREKNVDWIQGGIARDRAVLRLRLAERQECHCPYCGQTFRATDIFDPTCTEIDHVIERSIGGDSPDNLVLAHKRCNDVKNKRTPYEFKGEDLLDRPAVMAMWRDFRKSGRTERAKGAAPTAPWQDKAFMDRIGWRFGADARTLSEERGRRQDRMLHDTARATRLARLYLTALVMPENPDRLGSKSTERETDEELYRALARVRPVNGNVTAMLRRRLLQTDKDRDGARHHAEDACLLLLAGPAVVQAFNTESARKGNDALAEHPPADVGRVADEHHLQRLRRRTGRVGLPSLNNALERWIEPGSYYDTASGREVWTPTQEGRRIRNRIRDLVAKAAVEIRPEKPPERGTPEALHDDNPYGRTDVRTGDGTVAPVFHKRKSAGFLIGLINDKGKTTDGTVTANPGPGALVETVVRTVLEPQHDRIFDPQERFRHRWKSTLITAMIPRYVETVLAEMAELAGLDAIPDKDRTPDQAARWEFLKQGPLRPAVTGPSEATRIRAREAEILRRILRDRCWGPRGLRGLSMEEPKVKPVLIRTGKRDALGRPDPGAKAWVKTNGNAVTQLWRIASVVTADGERLRLPKPVTVTIHVSNLELSHLNAIDAEGGQHGDNRAPPLRLDLDRLIRVRGTGDAEAGGYIASVVPKIVEAVGKHATKLLKKLKSDKKWLLDSECVENATEVSEGDTIYHGGMAFRVTVMTKGYVWGLPVDYALSAPRDSGECSKFKERYACSLELGKGVRLPVEAMEAKTIRTRRKVR